MKITIPNFFVLLTLLFIYLKLTDHIPWSWIWILSPLWIAFLVILGVLFLAIMVLVILKLMQK